MNKIDKLLFGIIALWVVLAVIFGFYDLEISKYTIRYKYIRLYNFGNNYGDYLVKPLLYICITILLGSIFNDIKMQRKIGTIMMCYSIYKSILEVYLVYKFPHKRTITPYLIPIFLITFLILTYNKNWRNYLQIAISIIFLFILSTIIIGIMKFLWGRVRYEDLTSNSEFTEWYIINGARKHSTSFPSGHTANACIFYPLLICINNKKMSKKLKIILVFVVIGFSLYVGISRVVIGKHYTSDILFSIGICSMLTIYFYKICNNFNFGIDPILIKTH